MDANFAMPPEFADFVFACCVGALILVIGMIVITVRDAIRFRKQTGRW